MVIETHPLIAAQSRWVAVGVLAAFMVALTPSPGQATVTYAVPETGLSFDANSTTPSNACTTGFGNLEVDPENVNEPHPDAEDDEVNLLKAGDALRYNNVATIDGQVIDANVTLTSIVGTQVVGSEPRLRFLDTCVADDESGQLKTRMRSVTPSPGEASAVLTIDFLLGGTSTPATLTNLRMNVEDVDANEFVEVDNFASTRLAADRSSQHIQEYVSGDRIAVGTLPDPVVSATPSARRFHAIGESPPDEEKHVVEVSYPPVSTIVVRLGVYQDRSPAINLNFKSFAFTSPTEEFFVEASDPPAASEASDPPADRAGGLSGSIEPAIHLDLKAKAGNVVAGAPVLIEGQALQPGSTYSLVVRSTPVTVATGTVSKGGRFSSTVNLPPGIAPGTHTVTLTAIGSDASTLSLVTTFVVSSTGTFTSISPGVGSVAGGLAATGPNSSALSLGVASSLALLALGLAAIASTRRKTARVS